MEIDILFKSDTDSKIFKKLHDGWKLAPTDQDTYKYTLQTIMTSCDDKIDGIIIKIRSYKYDDPKMLWASVNIDKIINILNPGGNNITNWLSNTLEINAAESTCIIEKTKDMGVWIDKEDMTLVIDAWKKHSLTNKDLKQIEELIDFSIVDNNITSPVFAMDIIRQYNKLSNDITSEFLMANVQGIYDIAKENFDCDLTILIDAIEIQNTSTASINRSAKNKLWKLLVDNRGIIEKLKINIDTDTPDEDVEISDLKVYDDATEKLHICNMLICYCDIKNALLENCISYRSTFTKCEFKDCSTMGVRVKIKDCKGYEDNLKGVYNIEDKKDDKKDDKD